MTNYGYGWECETSEYSYKEIKQRKKEYEEKLKEVAIIKRNYEELKESINRKITPNK